MNRQREVLLETTNPIMDRKLALSRVGGDLELLREIGQLFLEEYPGLLARLTAAVASNDAHAVDRTAHSIKGSVANFGAQSAYDAALALEQMGRTGKLRDAQRQLGVLDRNLAALHAELEIL